MKKFIFDVDGTLTPSRQNMNGDFQHWFLDFCYGHKVYLVTGSDYIKTTEQVGIDICEAVEAVYNCSGADVWTKGVNTFTTEWKLTDEAQNWLSEELTKSDFPLRTGLHFEHRPGMCNFSIVGRNATLIERKQYVEWDTATNERNTIAKEFNIRFPEAEARVGGETGIDIFQKGNNKSQILRDFDMHDEIHFFGDAMGVFGNDYPLKKELIDKDLGMCYTVKDWKETWKLLKDHD